MQYKGSKKIRRVAAIILSAALMVTELPNTGLAYAVQATESPAQEGTQMQELESQHTEESSQLEESQTQEQSQETGTSEEQETQKQTEVASEVPESSEAAGTEVVEASSEAESETELETESETESEVETESDVKESELVTVPTVDTGVYEYEKRELVVSNASHASLNGAQLLSLSETEGTYTISNKDDFMEFINSSSNYSGKTVKLDCDINLDGATVSLAAEFKGTFDGQAHSIENFKTGKGLFQTIGFGATVQNLHLSKVSFDGTSAAGAVTADNFGTISNVTVTGTLTASTEMSQSAGIAAKNENGATIKNCVFAGTMSAQGETESTRIQGGIVAKNEGTISECYTYGTMTSDIAACAGIAAENNGEVKNCSNYLKVSGCYNAAGIVAENTYRISNCVNYGAITQNNSIANAVQTGGIAAKNTKSGELSGCYNYGDIRSVKNNVAGIAGINLGSVSSSANFGNVSGLGNVAGIVGQSQTSNDKTIDKCFNVGAISGDGGTGIGGIVGGSASNFSVAIENCYNRGTIGGSSATNGVGGIAGILENGSIFKCYNAGTIPAIADQCVGNIAGLLTDSVTASDCYYLENSEVIADYYTKTEEGASPVTKDENKKSTDDLKASVTGDGWGFVPDDDNKNAGYPIISGQRANTKDYLVVYELNGGCSSKYYDIVVSGGTVTQPENPTKTGAAFKAWYSDEELSAEYSFDTAVTAATKVYAGWTQSVCVTDFSFPQTSVELVKEETFTIPVVFVPEDAENKKLTWSSDNPSVVTVDDNGKLTAVNKGTAKITAKMADNSLSKELTFTVTVTDQEGIIHIMTTDTPQVEVKELNVSIGEPVTVEAVVGGNVEGQVSWQSTDETVATVEGVSGDSRRLAKITAIKPGTTIITANLGRISATLEVTVPKQATEVVIKLDDDVITNKTVIYDLVTNKFIAIGKEKGNRLETPVDRLSATVLPSEASQKVEWKSDNESVIKFDDKNSGVLTSNSNGIAQITATTTDNSDKSSTTTIEAFKVVQTLEFEPKELSSMTPVTTDERGRIVLTTGGKIKLEPKYLPADATKKEVSWSISDKNALSIDPKTFEVTAGEVTKDTEVSITARSLDLGPNGDGAQCTAKFIIKPKVTKILIYKGDDKKHPVNDKNIGINPLNQEELLFNLSVKNEPENASQIVTWKTSDKTVAEITDNKNGTCQVAVSGKEGVAVITATAADGSGVTAKTIVNVTGMVTGINIKGSSSVMVGKSITLTAEVQPKSVKNKTVTWESLQKKTATVDSQTGKVTGISAGFATIIATANDGSKTQAKIQIEVTEPIEKFRIVNDTADGSDEKNALNGKSIGIDPDTEKNTYQLNTYIYPDKACQTVTWKSSNEKVATVDENGLVTAVTLGKATITATSTDGSGKAASVNLNVTTLSKSVEIKGSHYVAPEKSIQLTAIVGDKDALNKNVNWSSSDEGILTVDKKGKVSVVKGKTTGYAVIRAEAADGSGKYAEHKVIIKGAKDKVDVVSYDNMLQIQTDTNKNKYVELDIKDKEEYAVILTANLEGTDEGEVKDMTWTSSNTKLATVTSEIRDGKSVATVKLLEEGDVKITATTTDGYESKDAITFKIKNTNPYVKITGPTQVGSGKKIQLSAGKTAIGEWVSSNPDIATVNSRGQVSAKRYATGSVTITARAKVGTNYDTYVINVAAPVTKVDILLDGNIVTGKKLGMDLINGYNNTRTMQFTADVVGGDGVTWKSSNPKIATIDENGKVEALKTGKVTVTVTATDGSGKKASVTLTVAKQVKEIKSADNAEGVYVGLKKSVQLAVSYKPYAATTKKVTWSVAPEDKDYVSVNGSGKVTAKKQFSSPDQYATVIASAADDSGTTYAFRIYITSPVDKVEIVKEGCAYSPTVGIDLDTNDSKIILQTNLTTKVNKENVPLANQDVTWKSSNTKIAKIDEHGVVTGLATGQVTITATAKDGTKKSGKVNLYVGKLISSVTIADDLYSKTDINHLNKGRKIDLSKYVIIGPSTATKQTLTYRISDPIEKKIVTVDKNGKITSKGLYKDKKTGITYDKATITISTNDGSNIQKTVTVTVTN